MILSSEKNECPSAEYFSSDASHSNESRQAHLKEENNFFKDRVFAQTVHHFNFDYLINCMHKLRQMMGLAFSMYVCMYVYVTRSEKTYHLAQKLKKRYKQKSRKKSFFNPKFF